MTKTHDISKIKPLYKIKIENRKIKNGFKILIKNYYSIWKLK